MFSNKLYKRRANQVEEKKYKTWLLKFAEDILVTCKLRGILCLWIEIPNTKMAILSEFSLAENLRKLTNCF